MEQTQYLSESVCLLFSLPSVTASFSPNSGTLYNLILTLYFLIRCFFFYPKCLVWMWTSLLLLHSPASIPLTDSLNDFHTWLELKMYFYLRFQCCFSNNAFLICHCNCVIDLMPLRPVPSTTQHVFASSSWCELCFLHSFMSPLGGSIVFIHSRKSPLNPPLCNKQYISVDMRMMGYTADQ